nr:hypothetical protein [Candidatus Sigynarchaeota archaeon]
MVMDDGAGHHGCLTNHDFTRPVNVLVSTKMDSSVKKPLQQGHCRSANLQS